MADHRAEQILAAVQLAVANLTTSQGRVDRGRGTEIPEASTPALRVAVGDDQVVDPWAAQLLDSQLDVSIFAVAYDSATNIETLLNRMRAEVNVALMANQQLGLAFVHAIVELGSRKPTLTTVDSAKPGGSMELLYRVLYRRSRTDPSA